jgi:putative salt-induced outer membrane protein YdiY
MSLLLATVVMVSAADVGVAAPETNPVTSDVEIAELTEAGPLEAAFTQPLVEDKDKPLHKWSGTVSFGGSVWNGNTERKSATALADAVYRREKDRFTLKFFWSYAEDMGVLEDRITSGAFKYDYFLSKKSYLFAGAEAENNFGADLKLRSAVSGGYGFQWVENETWKFSTELGMAWFREEYYGPDPTNQYPAVRGAYKAEWTPEKEWVIANSAEIYQSTEYGKDVNTKMLSRARYNFTDKMFVEGIWQWWWDNTPATGKKRDDNIYTVNLGFAF